MNVVALVPAAGRGERLGANLPKALVPVLGVSLLVRAVRGLLDSARVTHVVVASPLDEVAAFATELKRFGPEVQVIPGGATRTESVRVALAQARITVPDCAAVLVHDAARAFTPVSVIQAVVGAVEHGAEAVVPVLPVADTIKQVAADGHVSHTVDRARLRSVQTPQGFAVDVLHEAYEAAHGIASDDAGLVESIGGRVTTVPGHPHALKITTPFDLALAESMLATSADVDV